MEYQKPLVEFHHYGWGALDRLMNGGPAYELLHAFTWDATEEGTEYWRDLQDMGLKPLPSEVVEALRYRYVLTKLMS